MSSTGRTVGRLLGWAVAGAVTVYAGKKLFAHLNRKGDLTRAFDAAATRVDQKLGWHKLPPPLGLLVLVGMRGTLREDNLTDTGSVRAAGTPPVPPEGYLEERSADGIYNDLKDPMMGSANTRFGRNAPLGYTYPDDEDKLLHPSPRTVSVELMTRDEFQPARTLNLLAAAWLQFMVRDWLSHGRSNKDNPWQVPLPPGDDWHENPMRILRTAEDPTRTSNETNLPPTHLNTETHWWDASQLYGSDLEFQKKARTGIDGKLHLDRNNLEVPDTQSLVQQANLAGWWTGLELMFTLFALEHNAICDRLKSAYPDWSDEALFQHARLINAALLAKIHTVEWTTAILGHPTLQIAMRANWWGVLTETVHKLFGRLTSSEVLSGIPGSNTDHFGIPYSITEEFVAVYRMHPLIPDDLTFRSARTDTVLGTRTFEACAGLRAQNVTEAFGIQDLLYSFGRMNPGAVTLHNFPRSLQRFERPDGVVIDLAAHDILRSRELGVPKYNEFRRLMHMKPVEKFEDITPNREWSEQIKRVYEGDIERIDLSIGLFAETPPPGFGFSDTAFRIFILMASRRLNSDRFFTTHYTPEVYTPEGMKWIDDNNMGDVLKRHFPDLAAGLEGVSNAFAPWTPANA
jgi:Animal haem peroxidase